MPGFRCLLTTLHSPTIVSCVMTVLLPVDAVLHIFRHPRFAMPVTRNYRPPGCRWRRRLSIIARPLAPVLPATMARPHQARGRPILPAVICVTRAIYRARYRGYPLRQMLSTIPRSRAPVAVAMTTWWRQANHHYIYRPRWNVTSATQQRPGCRPQVLIIRPLSETVSPATMAWLRPVRQRRILPAVRYAMPVMPSCLPPGHR